MIKQFSLAGILVCLFVGCASLPSGDGWTRHVIEPEKKSYAAKPERPEEKSVLDQVEDWKKAKKQYVKDNPNLSPAIAEAILKGYLVRGMRADQVKLAWVAPEGVNSSTGAWGESEQWVYHFKGLEQFDLGIESSWYNGSYYLYFSNGILTSWQHSQ